jgi:crotonobetainyl-CoA:carnitine CoA-transferase CaiB-like acyl-CoA transferase
VTASEAPLAGIRVLDLSAVVVGPYATKILADYGADVIKVETKEGDLIRWIAGPSPTPGMSGKYVHLNPGKRSIALDLKHPQGKAAVLALAKTADVLTINMRPEAIRRLGLAYDDLAPLNPRLVYCSMVGFGENGRYRGKPAFDSIIQGASGLANLFERATGTPHYVPMVIADRSVGLMVVNAIMMALFQRTRTGRGQSIEVPMFENMAAVVLAEHLYGSTYDPPLAPPGDPRLLDPEARPVKTADGYVCVTTNTDAQAFALMAAIGRPELRDDPRFSTKLARSRNSNAFFRIRAEEIAKKTSADWIAILEAADIPVMPYHTLETLPHDPHLQDVGLLKRVQHPTEGAMWEIANPIRHSDFAPAERTPPPHIGEHTREVLREAGFDEAAIEAMFAAGAAAGG